MADKRRHPHPMPGCLVAFPIKKIDNGSEDGIRQVGETDDAIVYEVDLRKVLLAEEGFHAGQVLEIGPHDDERVGIEVGSVVYYPDSRAVQLGEFVLIQLSSCVAYDDPLD